jgi:hypothetical protein
VPDEGQSRNLASEVTASLKRLGGQIRSNIRGGGRVHPLLAPKWLAAWAALLAAALWAVFFVWLGPIVYVAGFEGNTAGVGVATVWHNGEAQQMPFSGAASEAAQVFVAGGDVYLAGSEGGAAVVWKTAPPGA